MKAVVAQLVKLDPSNQQLDLVHVLHVEQGKRQQQQHRILKEIVVGTIYSSLCSLIYENHLPL